MTLSTNKDKYGVRLRAEPDHMVLGKRLKGAFKLVMAAIKELKSEQLEEFQETGTWWYKPLNHSKIVQKNQKKFGIYQKNPSNCTWFIYINQTNAKVSFSRLTET